MVPPHPLRRQLPADALVSSWTAPDGWPIRRFDWPVEDGAGAILFLGGRGDVFEKYLDSFAHWHRAGWSVTAFDWRGHGGSGRLTADAAVGHVRSFDALLDDLAAFWAEWDAPGPRIVMGHSMGGNVVLRAIGERAIDPAAAVLLAPTIRIRSPLGARLTEWLVGWQCRRGDPGRAAWTAKDTPAARMDAAAMLTGDYTRVLDEEWWHERMPGTRLGPPSWGWLGAAIRSGRAVTRANWRAVAIPLLFMVADDDRLVDARAVQRLARRCPSATLTRFGRGVGHELLRERDALRGAAMAAIDSLLADARARG
jgi:lysophospholipase